MPPKKGKEQPKQKGPKVNVDKGFGMKNKNKSKRVQQQITQMSSGTNKDNPAKKEAEARRKAEEKRAAEEARRETAKLFGVQQQKVPFGVDPKSVLCEFFKNGLCNKGNKCKFSHDPNVGRKDSKKDLYTDAREEKEADTMDKWDEEKLRKVILSKHGNPKTTTDKICKYFIDAVENDKYGWFWVCPNGGNDCMYRHSLPPGFVLKTKEQKRLEKLAKESEPEITLEEFIELERGRLDKSKFTPITAESFAKWKKNIKAKKDEKDKTGKKKQLTGREVILQRFADKFEDDNTDQGDEMDLSSFKQALPDEDIKDYGDGSKVEEEYQSQEKTGVESTEENKTEVAA